MISLFGTLKRVDNESARIGFKTSVTYVKGDLECTALVQVEKRSI